MFYGYFLLYVALSSLRVTGAIWILFLLDKGFTLTQIGLVESIWHLTAVTLEVPSGYLADRLGRRVSFVSRPHLRVSRNGTDLVVSLDPLAGSSLHLFGAVLYLPLGRRSRPPF